MKCEPGLALGLGLTAQATLMFEILLTRIFSVTLWYHFAFVAISIALFGMSAGAMAVHLWPRLFSIERTRIHLAIAALAFAAAIPLSVFLHLRLQFDPLSSAWTDLRAQFLTYAIMALPFIFGGIATCLALTRFPERVGVLYGADLTGAALGCAGVVGLLEFCQDGPTAILVAGAVASLGALAFAGGARRPGLLSFCAAGAFFLTGLAGVGVAQARAGRPPLRLLWTKGERRSPPIYERWNAQSRIEVIGEPDRAIPPQGWGLSLRRPGSARVPQLNLVIDACAGTYLTRFDGDLQPIAFLKDDITNLAHHLRPEADVAVIGAGGGRDILAALVFGQRAVTGVEINGLILKALRGPFAEFTGWLADHPRVRLVHDEARSFLTRSPDRFDIIQASLIDTWAATQAGAFVLSENSLYTLEAWDVFLDRLRPRGLLSMTRWHLHDEMPGEIYRLAALAAQSLARRGVEQPGRHLLVARLMQRPSTDPPPHGLATLLVSPSPLSEVDVAEAERICDALGFDLVYSPRAAADPTLAALAGPAAVRQAMIDQLPVDVSPPTDDRPFFFHMMRPRDLLQRGVRAERYYVTDINLRAASVLAGLFLVVLALTVLCLILPAMPFGGRASRAPDAAGRFPWAWSVFFASIGLGFMLVEIAMMQRLMVFLGRPTYSLSVVLFALLLSGGVGSFWIQRRLPQSRPSRWAIIVAIPVVLGVAGVLVPVVLPLFRGGADSTRVLASLAALVPMGLVMGTAFPLGLGLAERHPRAMLAWFWGINGATSVLASVAAAMISLWAGIGASFWSGVFCYSVACVALARASRVD